MAKKKGSKKSKKTASDPANGMDIVLPEDKIKYLEGQTKSLELQLAHRVETCASTTMEYESMKQSLHEALQKYEQEKETTVGLTRDMTRQYKGMQDDLLNKINSREKSIQKLTDTLESIKSEHELAIAKKDEALRQKDHHIMKLNEKLEDLCSNFASMIKATLIQMKDSIENQGADYKENVPIQNLMNTEEFNYKST